VAITISHPRTKPVKSKQALIPAAARTSEMRTPEEDHANAEAIDVFAKAVGGREALTEVLAVAETAPDVERVVNLLLDPRMARMSLKRVCAMANLTVADLFAAYKKACITRAHIQASHIIASRLPPIVDDVMLRATPVPVACPACDGTARRPVDGSLVLCTICHGTGTVLSEPDLDRQKLALELGQLTSKSGGLVIQQNQIAASVSAPGGGVLEQLQQAVGDLLFSPARRRATSPALDVTPESVVEPDATTTRGV
jgi:hypothetical protein